MKAPPPFTGVLPTYVRPESRAEVREATKRDDYEGAWVRVPVLANAGVRVFETSRRWRGIDVFVARPSFVSSGAEDYFRFRVYAVTEGMDRVLVATGIYRHPIAAAGNIPSTWVCGARVAADRFEVEVSFSGLPLSSSDSIDVGCVATDELVEIPPMLGAVPVSSSQEIRSEAARGAPGIVSGDPGFEIVSVHATMAAGAAPRWLHLHDLNSAAAAPGAAPVFAFGFPSIGSSINEAVPSLRSYRFQAGLVVAVSTTGPTTTLAANGDVAWQVFFR